MYIWGGLVVLALPIFIVATIAGKAAGRFRLAMAVALVVVVGLGSLLWLRLGEHQKWERVTVIGETQLKLSYTGSECEDQRSVDVDEDDDSVTITITARSYASECSDVGFQRTVTVNLDKPLGDRKLIDGAR